MQWSCLMWAEPTKEQSPRAIQGGLFSNGELEAAGLPPRRAEDERARRSTQDYHRNDARAAQTRLRHSAEQPLLPFDRPSCDASAAETNSTPINDDLRGEEGAAACAKSSESPNENDSFAVGEFGKARDLLQAIRILKQRECTGGKASREEQEALTRFGGFGAVALRIFPDPVTGQYKSPSWQTLGEQLQTLLTADEYASAKRTVFNAFYTSPTVVRVMFEALTRFGVPESARVLEPGCGSGNFLRLAPQGMRFVGVELDSLSGRIAQALYPEHEIRVENFRDTRLPEASVDAVIGNPPFADLKYEHNGVRFSLHDYFFAKSLDVLCPGGVLALVTSHFTLDKQNAEVREYLAARADFLGAIRLPSDAFAREGTRVVTDIVFMRRRSADAPESHVDASWLEVAPLVVEGVAVSVNSYFHNHPEMVLGTWSRRDRLYGGDDGYTLQSNGVLEEQLRDAVQRLPILEPRQGRGVAPLPKAARFVPPPLERHITEGSFLVGENQVIHQIVEGCPQPVVYGGTKLKANGTMSGKRLAALIRIRDQARLVLQSQNDGWPENHREAARRELNAVYDIFVHSYGLINKTTFSESSTGTIIQRMPNVVKFVEDPDAVLVLSLEECDPATGTAVKAAIMMRDVVGRAPEITTVKSAEEGLLVSLDKKGVVDLAFIAELYGKRQSEIITELGELLFQDPKTKAWLTADDYLSGNVREKLGQAERAGGEYARNVEALKAVQPEDVLPGEIDANLGAPWIPESDIQTFAAWLFGVTESSIAIGHLKKDAVWTLEAGYDAVTSVPATADYGTGRANGTTLFEQALNLKTPVIYDVVNHGDREERIVNQEETLAAREKQKRIKEQFRAWVFADPDRCERLVRVYNDTYNNLRLRVFDGSHLEFPGMNKGITLHPHQKDAVWRGMSAGNTLLAHVVGAGKTFTMCCIGMKRRQAGLSRKPLYVVPNHMLEQFAREFQQLYPNARLLIACKEDLARERRKMLTAKIASSEWDGIVITHSSFERIGMSRGYQERFLREQIAEYDALLVESAKNSSKAGRNIIKTIEKQKAKREERLKDLLAEDKKDDGLVFDELGVDYLFIDEAHYFKNLETPTKMERVAGIQTGGSERAFDLFMKVRYLAQQHEGHGVTFATGTPVSNTMVEMYTMQRYLDPKGLTDRGIEHFDGWAATFGEVIDTMEIAPDGASLRPRSRFAKFINLPELQQMFAAFADVQTASMLNLPTPAIVGGKPEVVPCPMSEEQCRIQGELVTRYERIRSEKVDPREDNALAITTDGRKLALDARLLESQASEHHDSKTNALVSRVADTWRRTEDTRSTQLVFCDMGVNLTPWGYSVYEEVIAKLVSEGIPRNQVAVIGDAESDAKKQALFERVRQGTIRILIGSTQKMGTGTNVQRRLAALHHLDAPWKPAEVEQREGRILRQGNDHKEVSIYRYVTEGSFDAYMWQALETKAKFISQVMTGEAGVRRADDIGGQELSYAEVKAIASGNPAVLTLAEADAELQRLGTLRKHHADEQFLARRNVRDLPEAIGRLHKRLSALEADAETARSHEDAPVLIDGDSCPRERLLGVLGARLDALPAEVNETRRFPLGRIRGLSFGVVKHRYSAPDVFLEGEGVRETALSKDAQGPRAVLNAVERLIASYGTRCEEVRRELTISETKLRDFTARMGLPFPHERYIEDLSALRDDLRVALSATTSPPQDGPEPQTRSTSELSELIKALKESHIIESLPAKRAGQGRSRQHPVVTRIHREQEDRLAKVEDVAPKEVKTMTCTYPLPSSRTATVFQPQTTPKPARTVQRRRYQKWLF